MRVLAVDYGDRRTGVAVSDISRSIAAECFVVDETVAKKLANRLYEEYRNRDCDTLVLGNPLNMDGTAGFRAEKTAKLGRMLAGRGANVVLRDERRTTAEAENILIETGNRRNKRAGKIDAVAASLILNAFLLEAKYSGENLSKPDDGR